MSHKSNCDNNCDNNCKWVPIPGPAGFGFTGPTGFGFTGPTGPTGPTGINGLTGSVGPTGPGALITLAPIGAAPNANGATLNGTVLNLQPASIGFGGVVTAGVQTFNGIKTFDDGIIVDPVTTPGVTYLFNNFAFRNYGGVNWTGAITNNAALAVDIVSNVGYLHFAYNIVGASPGGIITCSQVLDVDFRPGTPPGSRGIISVFDNGVRVMGAFQVSPAGVITVGASTDSSGNLIAFTASANSTGILGGVGVYSLY